jgi:hypothetical protein
MKNLLRALLLTALIALPGPGWSGSLTLLGVGSPGTATITFSLAFTDHQEESSGSTTITYTALGIGAADPNRIIAVAIGARMGTVNAISSVTIQGIAATLVSSSVAQVGGTNGANSAIYQAAVPTGTTANVVVTYGAATQRTGVSAYRIITGTPTATSAATSVTNISTLSLTIPSGGSGFAFNFQQSSVGADSWTGATQDYTALANAASRVSSATVSATGTVTPNVTNTAQTMSAAAWGP